MDREDVKLKLKKWGECIELCKANIERIQYIKELCEETRTVSAINYERQIGGGSKNTPISTVEKSVIKTIDVYQKSINEIEEEIENLMRFKTFVDKAITILESDERKIIYLRYDKGLSWDSIPRVIHKSRMQCFRIHNKVLDKLSEVLDV